jgi:hypothetical protein
MVSTRKRDYGEFQDLPDPRKSPADGVCVFLKLPGEIRNRIYEFALKEPTLYVAVPTNATINDKKLCTKARKCLGPRGKSGKRAKTSGAWEANQLQYVNKQLRDETRGFGLKVNDLHFTTEDAAEPSPLQSCLQFLDQLTPYWTRTLSNIVLKRHEPMRYRRQVWASRDEHLRKYIDLENRDKLVDICRINPQMTIKWALPRWNLYFSFCTFIHRGIIMTTVYRNKDLMAGTCQQAATDQEHTDSMIKLYRNEREPEFLSTVPNFKIFPQDFGLPENILRANLDASIAQCTRHLPGVEAMLGSWKAKTLDWYRDGI